MALTQSNPGKWLRLLSRNIQPGASQRSLSKLALFICPVVKPPSPVEQPEQAGERLSPAGSSLSPPSLPVLCRTLDHLLTSEPLVLEVFCFGGPGINLLLNTQLDIAVTMDTPWGFDIVQNNPAELYHLERKCGPKGSSISAAWLVPWEMPTVSAMGLRCLLHLLPFL